MGSATSAPKPRTESLYFRASPDLRESAESFGEERGLTLSAAVSVLVERGIEAVEREESRVELQNKVQALSQALAVAEERDRTWRAIFESLSGQLRTITVGECPTCQKLVSAYDQFLARRCPWPGCTKPMQQVLPRLKTDEFPPILAALVGAIGGFLFGLGAQSAP